MSFIQRQRLLRPALVAAIAWTAAAQAGAQPEPHMPTPAELMAMPEYCQAKLGTNQALHDQWRTRMGPELFMHLHHFCHGLKHMRRATSMVDAQKRRYQYERASAEFDYVLQRWPADFQLYATAKQQQQLARTFLGHK